MRVPHLESTNYAPPPLKHHSAVALPPQPPPQKMLSAPTPSAGHSGIAGVRATSVGRLTGPQSAAQIFSLNPQQKISVACSIIEVLSFDDCLLAKVRKPPLT